MCLLQLTKIHSFRLLKPVLGTLPVSPWYPRSTCPGKCPRDFPGVQSLPSSFDFSLGRGGGPWRPACRHFCCLSAGSEQPLGCPPTPGPTSKALWTKACTEPKPFAGTLSTALWLKGPKGARGSPRGCWTHLEPASLSSTVPACWTPVSPGPGCGSQQPRCVPGQACPLPGHLLSRGPAGVPSPRWGSLTLAPAARPLANSDYFSFSLLSWAPLFLTVHFLWTQD